MCLTIALINEVFFAGDGESRLRARLVEARSRGATLALLPELPLNPWSPATKDVHDADAEPPEGPRHRVLSGAALEAGLGLVGGAIVRDPETGRRHNTALVFDADGRLVATYRKLHLPEEDGFWETSHYEPGDRPPEVISAFAMPLGIQICSDANRPEGSHLLASAGAEVILVPRATEARTWERWKLVLRANAITSAAYLLSVSRPDAALRIPLGGPSAAIDPHGDVVMESSAPLAIVTLRRASVQAARVAYPGYLPVRSELYARGWARRP
jgi:N-carbamoylputrescine amidase